MGSRVLGVSLEGSKAFIRAQKELEAFLDVQLASVLNGICLMFMADGLFPSTTSLPTLIPSYFSLFYHESILSRAGNLYK